MQSNGIAFARERVQFDIANAVSLSSCHCTTARCQYLHAERLSDAGDGPANAAVANQLRQIEVQAQSSYRFLSVTELTMMHSQSKQAADLADGALKQAQSALDAMGTSMVETARQRQALERQARTVSGAERASLEREINSLHQLRDVHLVPDKDRLKRQRDLLRSEVTRLNRRAGELRDHRDSLRQQRGLSRG